MTSSPMHGEGGRSSSWFPDGRSILAGLAIGVLTGLCGALATHAQPKADAVRPIPQVEAPKSAHPSAEAPSLVAISTAQGRDAFTKQYCGSCHSARVKTGGLVLEGVSSADVGSNAELWEKVARRVAAGEMPPPGAQRPEAQLAHGFAASLVTDLDAAGRRRPFAGSTVIRRLNRTEYGNAVRDLLAVEFPFSAELPPDGQAVGFDNIADALSMSPVLLESYLRVGRKVAELAVGVTDPTPVTDQFPATRSQAQWLGPGAPFETRGGAIARKYFPREGEYELRAFLHEETLTPVEGVRLFRTRVRVKPGVHAFVATFPTDHSKSEGPVPNLAGAGGPPIGGPPDARGSAVRPTIAFLLDGRPIKEFEIHGPTASEATFEVRGGPPALARVEISGPFEAAPVVESASREQIFVCRPQRPSEEAACAERILKVLSRRAFRRDVTDADVLPFVTTYQRLRASRDFDQAIAASIRDVLIAPDFLFRLEFDPKTAKPGQLHRISSFELASRLSFFLWSTIPDDRLLDSAASGRLRGRAGLEREVRRMLADPKADALVDNWAAQWLSLRDLAEAQPDAKAYPDFDEALRDSFREETRLFLRSITRENRSILDVVNSDYTYVNERLAGVYGIPAVKGPGFRRVRLEPASGRGGIFGHGSILMVTSHTNKTSPVLRGKWVLDNLLNAPPPSPPAGVPPLDESPIKGRQLTTRQQVERHRASPVCSSCHSRMDPYGFALENYDVIGRWRTKDEGGPIDATAKLPDGRTISGPAGLRKSLSEHPEPFVGATVARLMTYALGRPMEGRDQPTIREIVRKTGERGYRFEDLVLAIVNSPQFQTKQTSSTS